MVNGTNIIRLDLEYFQYEKGQTLKIRDYI